MTKRLSQILFLVFCLSLELSCASSRHTHSSFHELFNNKEVWVDHNIIIGECVTLSINCESPLLVNRKDYSIDCYSKQTIDGIDYFFSGKCLEVGSKETLSFPSDLLLFDSSNKLLKVLDGSFQSPSYSSKVRIGSRKKGSFSCTQSKIFYKSDKDITIPVGKGLILPQDCIIVNERGEYIIHNGFYFSKQGNTDRIKIACTHKTNLNLILVPVIELPNNIRLYFKNDGKLSNGIILCDGLVIQANKKLVFDNVILSGPLKNKALLVEWFGCSTQNEGQRNKEVLEKYVIPSAIACHSDVYHSEKGIYKITGAYPVNNSIWGFDHACIKDFGGITVYGTGPETVILSCLQKKDKPSDIFNIVDSRNLTIRDLSVTHQVVDTSINNGSNAFSLVHSNENILIEHCRVYSMPYVEGPVYPDGGKAFTIQAGPNTNQHNIKILNNKAEGVSYGLDYTKTSFSEGDNLENILFEGNEIHNAIVGAVVHEWDSPYGENVNPVIVNNNTIKECQVGILCQTTKSCNITNNFITNNKRPSRLLYYKGVYGIHTLGAYNTTIERNQIELKEGDAFLNVNVYSYYPRFNGAVKNMTIKKNVMRGKASDTSVRVGKKTMTKEESKMFENISIIENTIKQ